MRVVSFAQDAVPALLRTQVMALEDQEWPTESRDGHDPALHPIWMMLVDPHDTVLASLAVLSKSIIHDGERYLANGLSAVVTDRAHRGRGHGQRLVHAARDLIAAGGADLGIFTCDPPLADFYQRCGWRILPGTVLVGGTPDAPFPSDRFGKVTLATLFTEHARTHAATFEHARIELYPGEIDKLW
jgi:Predicted acyltransferase